MKRLWTMARCVLCGREKRIHDGDGGACRKCADTAPIHSGYLPSGKQPCPDCGTLVTRDTHPEMGCPFCEGKHVSGKLGV